MDVDLFNYNKLIRLPGEMNVFKSVDEGSEYYLNKFLATKNLGLKVGCPVMLVKNLTSKLGMSFKSVVVNCQNCFQPGQIGVAVGRAETIAGLKIVNFKKSLCRNHPSHVTTFYETFSIGVVEDDLSCCRLKR
ncbi:hypothetical protein KUTeg_020595 [Tegillarca granosa]|uniref:DNA helicase Pif1-like 2B domain-containing protein n=1 Tax=Tegillarca granosa TaxID=220873 RepID=A0ABQ9E8D4_TEGGR|nr:hypothetical protein KUTeg_020595 [Tegillarca granosa]